MNLYRKYQMFILRRSLNQSIWQSTMEFRQFKLRESEKILIIFLTCLISIAITLKYADYIDNARLVQFDRALKAESEELKSSAIIATMLNNDYLRVDGVRARVKLQFCTAAGDCK